MKFAINTVIFREWELAKVIPLLKKYGYDGVEIAWIPPEEPLYTGKDINVPELKKICSSVNLEIADICPFYPAEYDISHVSDEKRQKGVDFVKKIIDAANELETKTIILVPSAVFAQPSGSFEETWSSCVKSLKELGTYADKNNVKLAIEPLNRFLTHFVTRIDQAIKLVKDADAPGIGIMADIFMMNMEERSIEESLRQSKDYLLHVHISDSNNFIPGTGHLDFDSIFKVLSEIGYKSYVSAEMEVNLSEAAESAKKTIDYMIKYR